MTIYDLFSAISLLSLPVYVTLPASIIIVLGMIAGGSTATYWIIKHPNF
ncbi:MAG: hypothetical protein WC514_00815 [Candidatus Paceibacterota bacterium]